MPISIHGKQYVTVAERLAEAHEKNTTLSIQTEVIPNGGSIVVKATVTTKKGVFTGISAANTNKSIEKMSPYEVAETSAVGRALGFAGYGVVEGIATADEITKADPIDELEIVEKDGLTITKPKNPHIDACLACGDKVPLNVKTYSQTKYGKVLCFTCQKKEVALFNN